MLQFGQLNLQQIDLIKSKATIIEQKKGDYFSEAGKIARQVAFVDDGILRVCYYNNKGEEITRYFIDEHHFAVDLNSFSYQIPSSEYVQAATNCKLLVFSADALKDLSVTIINVAAFYILRDECIKKSAACFVQHVAMRHIL